MHFFFFSLFAFFLLSVRARTYLPTYVSQGLLKPMLQLSPRQTGIQLCGNCWEGGGDLVLPSVCVPSCVWHGWEEACHGMCACMPAVLADLLEGEVRLKEEEQNNFSFRTGMCGMLLPNGGMHLSYACVWVWRG